MRDFFRAVWFAPFFAANTAILGLGSLVTGIFSVKGARRYARWWARVNTWALGAELQVEGLENLPLDPETGRPVGLVVAANHSSAADIGAVLGGLPLDVCWVAKASLLKIPFLGWHLRVVHIPVARRAAGNTDRFLKEGAQKIRDGAAVVVFPEGTRNLGDGKMLPFRKGAFLLAHASGQPILPVAIIDSPKVWKPGTLLPKPGRIIMKIGPPLDPKKYSADEIQKLADDARQAIGEMLPEGYAPGLM